MDSEVHYQLTGQTGLQSQLQTLSLPMISDTISPKQIQAAPTLQDTGVSPQVKNVVFDSQLQDLRTLVSGLSNESQMLGKDVHSEAEKQHMGIPVNGMNQQIPITSNASKSTLNSEEPRNVINITDPSHLLDTLQDDFSYLFDSMDVAYSSLQSSPQKNGFEDKLFSPMKMDSGVSLASYASSEVSSQPMTACDSANTPFVPVSLDSYASSQVISRHATTYDTANTPFVPSLKVSESSQTATQPTVITSLQASCSSMELGTVTSSTAQSTPVVYLNGNQLVYPMSSITLKDNGILLSDNQTVFLLDSQSATASGNQSVNPKSSVPVGSNQYTALMTFQPGTEGKNYNMKQVTETPTITVDPITTKGSDINLINESKEEMKSASQVTLEETVYALSETDYCQCDLEEKGEEVPVEQIFIRDGQMFRLPDVGTIRVGRLEFCGFRKQEKWYLGLAEVISKVGPIVRKEFDEALLNARDLDTLELDANEFELLLQRSKISRQWQLKDMMEVNCFHSIFEKLYKQNKDPVIKALAECSYFKKTKGSQVRCTNCGLKIRNQGNGERFELLLKKDVECPIIDENYTRPSAKYQSSVGFIHITGLDIKLHAFRLKGNDYISLREIVFKKIFSLTTLQKRLLHLQVRPIRAPSEIEYFFQLRGVQVQRTLWVDIVAVRCMSCLTGMKELDCITRAISCGQFRYAEVLTLITEDTTTDDTVFTLDEESLEICRLNEELNSFETKKSQLTPSDTYPTSQRTERRKKFGVLDSDNLAIKEKSLTSSSGQALSKLDDGKAMHVKIAMMDKRGKTRAVSHIKQNLEKTPVTVTIPQGTFIVEDLDTFLYKRCAITKPWDCKGGVKNAEKSKVNPTENVRNKTNSDLCNNEDSVCKMKAAADSSYVKENDLPRMLQEKTQTSHLVSAKSSSTVSPNSKNSSTNGNISTPSAIPGDQQKLSTNANLEDKPANPAQNNTKVLEVKENKSPNEPSRAPVGKVPPGSIAPGMYIVKDMESFLKSLQKEKLSKASRAAKTRGTSKTSKSNKSKHCQNDGTDGRQSSQPSVQKDHTNVDRRVETRKESCPSGKNEESFVGNTSDVCWEEIEVSDTEVSQTKDRNKTKEDKDNSSCVQVAVGETLSAKHSSAATVKDVSLKISQLTEMSTKGLSGSSSAVCNITAGDKDTINSNTQKTTSGFSPFTELGLDKPLSDNEKMQSPKQLFSVIDQVLHSVPSLETVTHTRAHTSENSSLTPSPNILKTASSTSKRKSNSPTKLKVRMNFSKAPGTPMEPRCQRNLSFILGKSNKEKFSVEKSDSVTTNKTGADILSLEASESLGKRNAAINSTVHGRDESVTVQDSSKEHLHTNPNLQEKAVVKLNESEILDAACISNPSSESCPVSRQFLGQSKHDEVMKPRDCDEPSVETDKDIDISKHSFHESNTPELYETDDTPVTITNSSNTISNDCEVEVLELGIKERKASSSTPSTSQISEDLITSPSDDTKAASASSPRLQRLSTKIASIQQASGPGDSLQMLAAIAEAMNDDSDIDGANISGASGDNKNKQRKFPIDISSLDMEQRKVFAIKLKEKMEEMLTNIKNYIEVRRCEGSNEMFKVRMRFKPGAEKVFPALVKPGAKEKRQQFVMVLSRILARKFWSSQLATQELKTSTQSDMAADTNACPENKEDSDNMNENIEQCIKGTNGGASDSEKCADNEATIPGSESKLSVLKIEQETDSLGNVCTKEYTQNPEPGLRPVVSPKVHDRTEAICGKDKVMERKTKECDVEGQTDEGKQASRALRLKKRPAEENCFLSNSKRTRK